jgi:hypothetical protein
MSEVAASFLATAEAVALLARYEDRSIDDVAADLSLQIAAQVMNL